MTPREYIEAVVRPNLADLEKDEGNLRHALNAVHAVDALAARIYVAAGGHPATGEKDDSDFRGALARADTSGNFRLLRDLAKAMKHAELHRGTPLVSSAKSTEPGTIVHGSIAYGVAGGYGVPSGGYSGWGVIVRTDRGEVHAVAAVVTGALAFLQEEMTRRGL